MDFVGLRNQVSVLLNNPDEDPPGLRWTPSVGQYWSNVK